MAGNAASKGAAMKTALTAHQQDVIRQMQAGATLSFHDTHHVTSHRRRVYALRGDKYQTLRRETAETLIRLGYIKFDHRDGVFEYFVLCTPAPAAPEAKAAGASLKGNQ
jgi:hypothetical protein